MNRRTLALALFVSLLANVFLASVLVAHLLMPAEPQVRKDRYSFVDEWRALAETLPEPQRAAALQKWQQQEEAWTAAREARRATRAAYSAALTTEPLDEAALRAVFAQMRADSNDRWAAFQEAVLATAPHLPLAQRQAYVAAAEARWSKRDAEKGNR